MKWTMLATMAAGLLASAAQAQGTPKAQALESEDAKTIYAFGYSVGKGLGSFALTAAEFELFQRAIAEGNAGTAPAVEIDQYAPKMQTLARSRQAKVGELFLEKAAQEKGAVKLPSGVIYKELQAGSGPSPKATDTVSVHYRGTLPSGEEFDSSIRRNQPAEFPLNGVIKCWTEGVQKMKVGTKAKLTCPPKTAYGERPPTGSKIPPNAVLAFEVELLSIPGNTSGQ
ncbi:FKBP-type peptidyl-prolyl cis-trans isomerase FkpA [Stigmatella aurantiaca]|uniref:Peptidyl-prolyl cis-trans isomerase n=1 Tax=Stigmatella aurantiaca TaxID=41 RepID=A0A1H8E6T9_STIAU|nr:FKBP-type peptidyl-prolyl cis-trans isomerase [Stigmatella aurantiaca]SEN15291.1 FKBP-type peptidyl-prolyl cis-trans isomerase FkpA [Stigmatella aurantiaca]